MRTPVRDRKARSSRKWENRGYGGVRNDVRELVVVVRVVCVWDGGGGNLREGVRVWFIWWRGGQCSWG